MARFQVYRARHDDFLLIDLQADLLDVLKTRIVAPLVPFEEMTWSLGQLNPRFEIAGQLYVMAPSAGRRSHWPSSESLLPTYPLRTRRSRQQRISFSKGFDCDAGSRHAPPASSKT